MSDDPLELLIDPTKAPALPEASEAGLYSPEAHSFTTAEQAEVWLNVAARELSGHGAVPGIHAERHEIFLGYDRAFRYSMNMRDEMAEQWKVEVKEKRSYEGQKWLSTSIACTTHKTGVGPYTLAVYRDSGNISSAGRISVDGHAYSVSKYVDHTLDGEYKPELTRTQPGELSEKESKAAEKRYIEMVNQFKQLLELKVAMTDINKIVKMNQLAQAEMPAHHRGLLEELHLAKVA